MNNSFNIDNDIDNNVDNDNDNTDNIIRPPDNIIREQLVDDNRSEFEKQIDEAIYLSLEDSKNRDKLNEDFEEELIKNFHKESIKRKEKFTNFLFNLNRLIRFDKEIKDIYEIIGPIIESYCSQAIEVCELDIKTHEKIFTTLSTIRTNKENIELLRKIILIEDNNTIL